MKAQTINNMRFLSNEATKIEKLSVAILIPVFSLSFIKFLEILVILFFGKEWEFNGYGALALSGAFTIILELVYFNFIVE